jgi:hypothetical protein
LFYSLRRTLKILPINIVTEDILNGDAVRAFVVLLSAVVAHGDMKRKENRDASRRGGSKT